MSRKPRKRRTREQKIRGQRKKAQASELNRIKRSKRKRQEKIDRDRKRARKKRMREDPVVPSKIIDGDFVEAVVESCWAGDAVGGCGGGMTREHIVSECVLPEGGNIKVRGVLPDGSIQTVSRKNFKEYVLCGNHNQWLSRGVDLAAREVVDIVRDSKPLNNDPDFQFRLAMWAIKTHCNLQIIGSINTSGYAPTHIGIGIVRTAFGQDLDMSYKVIDLRGRSPIPFIFTVSDVVTAKLEFGNKPHHNFDFQMATNNGSILYCCLHNILVMASLVPGLDLTKVPSV